MRKIFAFLAVLLFSTGSFAALTFPTLTGRVVDDAHILSESTIQRLDQSLADYENGTTNQVVVVTLQSLQGDDIEDYGYQLGRKWAIGQKGKDNGALLIIAPHEKKVRIEVGYGLEGTLTDAMSHQIIQTIILPEFKNGQMESGIIDGTQAILDVLGGKSMPVTHNASPQSQNGLSGLAVVLFILFFMWLGIRHPVLFLLLANNSRFGSSGGYGGGFTGGGGGFSGGGGSFGGGGSSGSW